MGLKERTIKNSFYSMLAQIIMILLRFLSRYYLLRIIGVETAGVSDTISSTVSALSLAEAGIGSAISYSLFTPLHDGDEDKINRIMNVFRRLYNFLSLFIFFSGFIGAFFLKTVLSGVDINSTVYIIYYLYVANTGASYLLCHRRTLLYADIKEYAVKRIDIATNFIFTIAGLVAIIGEKSIVLYVVAGLLQTVVSNIWIHVWSKKYYPYLKKDRVDQSILADVMGYTKDLFWGNIAGFVYNSTDNIIVSGVLGTINVGFLGNYMLVSKSIQTIVIRILSPVTPTLGRLQRENKSTVLLRSLFLKYHLICYIAALTVTIPMVVLFDGFIDYVFGTKYLLEPGIKYLLAYIFYVNIAAFSYGNLMTTSGEFKLLKHVEILGAVVNIVSSLIFVNVIGLSGVLLGTAITVTIQWIMRSHTVYKNILGCDMKFIISMTLKELYKILLTVTGCICGGVLYMATESLEFVLRFVFCGSISVALGAILYFLFYRFNDRLHLSYFLSILKERIK